MNLNLLHTDVLCLPVNIRAGIGVKEQLCLEPGHTIPGSM